MDSTQEEGEMPPPITGQKRAWEPGMPPESEPPSGDAEIADASSAEQEVPPAAEEKPQATEDGEAQAAEPAAAPAGAEDAKPAEQPPPAQKLPPASNAPSPEEQALTSEKVWLQQQNSVLQQQLAQLQQQHAALLAGHGHPAAAAHAQAAAAQAQAQQMQHHQHYAMQQQQQQRAPSAPTPMPAAHNSAWSEQINPENGALYYWNQTTGESTYTRPADYNPPAGGGASGGAAAAQAACATGPDGSTLKGPPGANLFIVRKMRRGEYDTFTDEDLRREFGKYGTVTRAEMTIDKETGWSRGYGFVSFSNSQEADAALNAVHGSWMAGREMKVEKTNEDR